ncbi:DUF721 domain-containing protein [bacterium]|nr:DUF721 domain-containing protein [bacterium]
MGEPKPIGELIGKHLASKRMREALRLARVRLHWENTVGPSLARRSQVVELRGSTAVIKLTDPAALDPLREKKPEIEERLRTQTSGEVKQISLVA